MKRSTGSCSAAHSPRNKFLNAHFLLNSFTAGYSLRRALIINGETLCPHCKQFEDTHHLLIRLSPKIKYSRNAKMTFFASQPYKIKEGKLVTPVFVGYYKHTLLSEATDPFDPTFAPLHSVIRLAMTHQDYIGHVLTMCGYLSPSWSSPVPHSQDGNQKTLKTGVCWSKEA